MRSPGRRLAAERALRGIAYALLAACAWLALSDPPARRRTDVRQSELPRLLPEWTVAPRSDTLALALEIVPGPFERSWLAALARAGDRVRWRGSPPATALWLDPLPDPAGGALALVAAPGGAGRVTLRDSLGGLDSAPGQAAGVAFEVAGWSGPVTALSGSQRAVLARADSLVVRRAVVLGDAGWESRFVIAALEERGWMLDARLGVAPGMAVSQGVPLPLDTARHALVVVLGGLPAAEARAVARFVEAGGGLVLGPGAGSGALARLAAAREGGRVGAGLGSVVGRTARDALAYRPLLPQQGAVVLERRAGRAVVAARRAGAGRVVQVGPEETWRWRLAGGADGPEAHRDWWARLAAAAAYRPVVPLRPGPSDDPAPLASLAGALGPADATAGHAAGSLPDARGFLPLAVLLLASCLLAEWGSRRLRGAA